jgi:hypothetical protein
MTHSPVAAQTGPLEHAANTSPGLRDPLRAVIALAVAASVILHVQMVFGGMHGILWSVVMAGMALGCLSCLVSLLCPGRSFAAVRLTMTMTRAMAHTTALAHGLMIVLVAGASSSHAHHEVGAQTLSVPGATQEAMLLIIILELAVGALAVIWTRRHSSDSTLAAVAPRGAGDRG